VGRTITNNEGGNPRSGIKTIEAGDEGTAAWPKRYSQHEFAT